MPNTHKPPYWVGFDLGGTKMMAAVFDGGYQRARTRTQTHQGPHRPRGGTGAGPQDDSQSGRELAGLDAQTDQRDRGRLPRPDRHGTRPGPGGRESRLEEHAAEGSLGAGVRLRGRDRQRRGCGRVYGEYRFGAARGRPVRAGRVSRHRHRRRAASTKARSSAASSPAAWKSGTSKSTRMASCAGAATTAAWRRKPAGWRSRPRRPRRPIAARRRICASTSASTWTRFAAASWRRRSRPATS